MKLRLAKSKCHVTALKFSRILFCCISEFRSVDHTRKPVLSAVDGGLAEESSMCSPPPMIEARNMIEKGACQKVQREDEICLLISQSGKR